VPRKTKSVEGKNQPPAESGEPGATKSAGKRRGGGQATAVRKPRKPATTKAIAGGKTKISASPKTEPLRASGEPPEDEIRLRAYFISERRRRFALAGDADSDWLEARRQLLAEGHRP
jgi:hypothetical protein